MMDVETYSAKELPGAAAGWIAARAEPAIAERGRFTIAVSGGSTPAAMFAELARLDLPWPQVHVFEVDERVAPDGDPDRNLNDLRANLLDLVPVVAHLMDVTAADLPGACRRYADELSDVTGDGVLDATTDTPRRGPLAIRSSTCAMRTSRSPSPIGDGFG